MTAGFIIIWPTQGSPAIARLHQLPRLIAQHPPPILEIEVSVLPAQQDADVRRHVLQHLGLVVDVEADAFLLEHVGIGIDGVHQHELSEADAVLPQISHGFLQVVSERVYDHVAEPNMAKDVSEHGQLVPTSFEIDAESPGRLTHRLMGFQSLVGLGL